MDETSRVAARIARAGRVACLTGAGISQESGIATFRDGETGLWSRFDPERLASQQGFAEDPGLVWRWYMDRLSAVEETEPNAGHRALATLAESCRHFSLITQNVDDLHERAGNRRVTHLHGQLARFHCNLCKTEYTLRSEDRRRPAPPICDSCGGAVRPSVIWFGEMLSQDKMAHAWSAVQECDLLLVVGTSGLVYPAAALPTEARRYGALIVDINIERGAISELADWLLRGASGQILPELVERVRRLR